MRTELNLWVRYWTCVRQIKIAFTYGFATGNHIPPGSSRVTIRLNPHKDGTELRLLHEFAESAPRDEHVQGWRFQLSLFSNVVANEVFADASRAVDAWFDAWNTVDDRRREQTLAEIATFDVRFRDRYSLLDGINDLSAHIGAAQRFMPVIAKHWTTACRLKIVRDRPHLTMRGTEDGTKTYFIDVFTWRDSHIPDAAPAAIQKLWTDMNRLVEARDGHRGLEIATVSIVAR